MLILEIAISECYVISRCVYKPRTKMKAFASIFFNSDYVEYLYSFETMVVFFQTTEYDLILSYFEMMSDA